MENMIIESGTIKLWPNQISDVRDMINAYKHGIRNFEVCSIPGAGKTYSVLFFLLNIKESKSLIIVPESIFEHWSCALRNIGLEKNVFLLTPKMVNDFYIKLMQQSFKPVTFDFIVFDEYPNLSFSCMLPIQINGLILISACSSPQDKLPSAKKNCLDKFLYMKRLEIKNKCDLDENMKPQIIEVPVRTKCTWSLLNNEVKITNEILSNLIVDNYTNIYFNSFEDKLFYIYSHAHIKEVFNVFSSLKVIQCYVSASCIPQIKHFIEDKFGESCDYDAAKYIYELTNFEALFDKPIYSKINKYMSAYEIPGSFTDYDSINQQVAQLKNLIFKITCCYEKSLVLEQTCLICYDKQCDIIMNCCSNYLHKSCLDIWMSLNKICPVCRKGDYNIIEVIPDLNDNINVYDQTVQIINSHPGKKIVIFSDVNSNAVMISNFKQSFNASTFGKCSLYKYKSSIDEFKAGRINILLVNKKICSECINFECADVLIITCKPDTPQQELQIIGRCLRPGRISTLKIYKYINNHSTKK